MATTPLPNLHPSLPIHGLHRPSHPTTAHQTLLPSIHSRRSASPSQISKHLRHLPSAVAKDDALSSLLTELEEEQEHDHDPRRPTEPSGPAHRWREIMGSDGWAGLLDPMDPALRTELVRYGEMAQACYDAFDFDPFSRYCGCCKYHRRSFFPSLGMPDGPAGGYDVSRYLYATSSLTLPNFFTRSRFSRLMWSQKANWIGYIAVSGDDASSPSRLGRRDIVVAWRGTVTNLEWVADLMDYLKPVAEEGIPCPDPELKVESGFLDLYTDKDPSCRFCRYSAREQVLTEVGKLVHKYTEAGEEVSITVTGHSLGSALAMLSAYDIAETGANVGKDGRKVPVTVISFGGPRVGNGRFKERFEREVGVKALRVVNVHDSVPKVPGIFFNEHVPEFLQRLAEGLPWSYHHVGVELALDHTKSPFLKETSDPSCFHNLEAHLHLLDGYRGRGERFVLASGRDPALVNKACDFLKDHHMVPPFWRQDENKGMIRAGDGRWVQPERPRLDDHPVDTPHHLWRLGLGSDRK